MSYVAKLYSNNINEGETYKEMPEIYQINFTWGLKEEIIRRKREDNEEDNNTISDLNDAKTNNKKEGKCCH